MSTAPPVTTARIASTGGISQQNAATARTTTTTKTRRTTVNEQQSNTSQDGPPDDDEIHEWDNDRSCCSCAIYIDHEEEEAHSERAAIQLADGKARALDPGTPGRLRRDSTPEATLASSLLCPGCYSVVPPPGVRILIDSSDPAYPSPVITMFCSAMCAESTATRQGFLHG